MTRETVNCLRPRELKTKAKWTGFEAPSAMTTELCGSAHQSMGKTRLPMRSGLTSWLSPQNFAITINFLAVALPVVALYFQDLAIVFNDALKNEATSHILIIPFLVAYLIYRKRKMLKASITEPNQHNQSNKKPLGLLSGILLCATAFVLYWYASYTFTPLEYHILTMPVFAAGLILILFTPQMLRQAIFPLLFLAFLTPPPSEMLYGIGTTLSVISSEISNAIVRALGIPSILSSDEGIPTITITKAGSMSMTFSVDIACSGVYSLIGFLVFAAFVAYITREKAWKKLSIFLVGLPLIYLLNVARITSILLIGYQYGEQLALELFHLLGGWILIFIGTLILLVITEKLLRVRMFARKESTTSDLLKVASPCEKLDDFRVSLGGVDAIKIVAVLIAMVLLISLQAPVFAATKQPAEVFVQTSNGEEGNTQILPEVSNYTLSYTYRDTDFEEKAGQDASLIFAYVSENQTERTVWVGVEISQRMSSLHRWEYCLVTWPTVHGEEPNVRQLELKDVKILENPPITARFFGFQYKRDNVTQLVLYWFETSVLELDGETQQKQVKISLISYPETPEKITTYENGLLKFATLIAEHWQPIKTWSQLTLIISQNGGTFALVTGSPVVALATLQRIEKRKTRRANREVYMKLSDQNKQIIDIAKETEKESKPTLYNIAAKYNARTEQTVTGEQLLQKFTEMEKLGIIESTVENESDNPVRLWKTQIS